MITHSAKRFSTLVLVVLCLSALLVGAVNAQEPPARTVSVTGLGEASGIPDMLYIYLGVDTVEANASTAIAQSNEKLNAIVEAVKEFGIEAKDIQTANFSVYPEDRYDSRTGMPTGERVYRVQQSVTVTVRDIAQAGAIIDASIQAGANAINGLSFALSDSKALESEARLLAVQDARARAEELATALGLTVGDALTVSEFSNAPVYPMETMYSGRVMSTDAGGSTQLNIGQMMVQLNVSITFELK